VIDALGDPLATDQRFFSRISDAAADVGAVER
jgi:hypothetical protein